MKASRVSLGVGGIILVAGLTLGIVVLASAESSSQSLEPSGTPLISPTATTGALSVTPTAIPEPTSATSIEVAIDTNPDGNGASSLGEPQECSEVALNSTFELDVTARDIPASINQTQSGIAGFDFTLTYDPAVLAVIEVDTRFLLAANAGSDVIDFTPTLPQDPGQLIVGAADFASGDNETGSGILARVSFQAIGLGSSQLAFSSVVIAASADYEQSVGEFEPASVEVGGSCPSEPTGTPVTAGAQ